MLSFYSTVYNISVNNVVLLSAPDFSQLLVDFLHVTEHKPCQSVLKFGSVIKTFDV